MTRKKLKYGGFSLLLTALFLTAVILLNIFAGMLTERFFLKADLTDTGIYTLDGQAAEFLRGIEEPVDVIVLAEESSWLANSILIRVTEILRNYSATSGGNLRVQYVNPDLNSFNGPLYNNSLSELKAAHAELENMTRDDIILLSSRRAARVSVYDLIAWSQGQPFLIADQELTGALVYVLNDRLAHAVFIGGHLENPAENLHNIFDRSGYLTSSVNLAFQDIPGDADILVSVAPKSDFADAEIVKLELYLTSGGNALIFYDFNTQSLPNLDRFLAEFGVSAEYKLVLDEQFTLFAQPYLIGAHVTAGALPSTAAAEEVTSLFSPPVGVPFARPLRAGNVRDHITLFPLISTFSATSYAKDIRDGNITTMERESGDESGPFILAYHIRHQSRDAEGGIVLSNLIVTGAEMIDDSFLMLYGDYFYNIDLIYDLVNDLNPFGGNVSIRAKMFSDNHMLVSIGGTRAILVLMVIALPLLIMLTGILVWRKRRHQ
jgi:ABC-2 type transport system permease protein